MRVFAGVLAVACLVLVACKPPSDALNWSPRASAARPAAGLSCPDGKVQQPGLTGFGAYIGTWQAVHQRLPQTSDYVLAFDTAGRIAVRCSASDHVVVEVINLKFLVPSGRALQFALTDLPSDSKQLFDHARAGCRSLQYESPVLAHQLLKDDAEGLADIAVRTPIDSSSAQLRVTIMVGSAAGDDVRGCV